MNKIEVNEWKLYFHPIFFDQLQRYKTKADSARKKYPNDFYKKKPVKLYGAIRQLIFTEIPKDPGVPQFRQGNTLGEKHRLWFRAKFFERYRIYYRFHNTQKIIIFGWVNDDNTLRAKGSRSDCYSVFKKMLNNKAPPTDWDELLKETEEARKRE